MHNLENSSLDTHDPFLMILILQLNIFNAPRTSQPKTLNNFQSYMAFKMKMKGIEGNGEGLKWFTKEGKVLKGVRIYFQMGEALKIGRIYGFRVLKQIFH